MVETMSFAGNLRKARKKRGMSMARLAETVGISRQTVHRYESGQIANIPYDRVEALAHALGVHPSQLMGWQQEPSVGQGVPILGDIACGTPRYAEQTYTDEFVRTTGIQADFCLRAHGDSMINARICHGDLVFVRRQESVDNGSIAAVLIDDETTLKRFYYNRDKEQVVLMPENPAFSPLIFEGEEIGRLRILGLAVGFQSLLH